MLYEEDIDLYVFYISLLEQETAWKGRMRTFFGWDLNLGNSGLYGLREREDHLPGSITTTLQENNQQVP